MNILWWLVSLAIAGAIIYYLVASRGEVRDGVGEVGVGPLGDQEFGDELVGEERTEGLTGGVVDTGVENGVEVDGRRVERGPHARVTEEDVEFAADPVPFIAGDENTPTTALTNLDAAAAIASRGAGGVDDVDEEYGAGLDRFDVEPLALRNGNGYGDDDDVEDDGDLDEDEGFIEGRGWAETVEDQTYMGAEDVARETRSEKKHHNRNKRQNRHKK